MECGGAAQGWSVVTGLRVGVWWRGLAPLEDGVARVDLHVPRESVQRARPARRPAVPARVRVRVRVWVGVSPNPNQRAARPYRARGRPLLLGLARGLGGSSLWTMAVAARAEPKVTSEVNSPTSGSHLQW